MQLQEIRSGYSVALNKGSVSVADLRGSPAGSRYDWLACGTPLSCRRRSMSQVAVIKIA